MGGAEYIRNLSRAIRAADPQVQISIICRREEAETWREAGTVVPVTGWPTRWQFTRKLGLGNCFLAKAMQRAGIEFVYPLTYDNEYTFGITLPLGDALPSGSWAGWVPDFQHRYLPQLFTAEDIAHRDRQIALLAEDAPKVVLSSEHAAQDFRSFYPAQAHKAHVLTFATFPQPNWKEPYNDSELEQLPERFFVICNQFWQHKNHLVVFRALELLLARGIKPTVVCTGELKDYRNAEYARTIKETVEPFQRDGQVRILGLVPRRRQIELLRRAIAVVQPSLFEGWSTVIEDARVLGRPCLLSDFPVHREQNPPGARFFPAESPAALADLLAEVWENAAPGPDLDSEAAARRRAEERVVEVGRAFLTIAGVAR